jgi:tetratricopeptide (TPR) repeat protein
MVQTAAKGLILFLAMSLFLGECSILFARNDDPGLLNQQVLKLYQERKYQEAVPIAERLLAIRKRALGSEDPDTATSLNNLGALYVAMGDYPKAKPLLEQAFRIRKNALGSEHPDTVISLYNLARLYSKIGDYSQAESLHQQALQIRRNTLGSEHPDTVQSLNSLAALYYQTGDYVRAEPLFQQALRIRKKLGPEHPDTAQSLNNLAALYVAMGDYAKAKPLLEQALRIRKKVFGLDHPDTANSLSNLASLYQEMANYAEAEPLFQQAIQINKKALGPEHPDAANSLNNLASLYQEMGDYARAESLFQQAIQILTEALGTEHPDTATSLNNLAALYVAMGDYAKAKPLFEQALQIDQKAFGSEHPDTARSLDNLAALYLQVGDYTKAEPLFQQALQIRKKALGPEHPATADSLNNLANLYLFRGDYARAEPLFEQALQIDQKALGPEHPHTITDLDNLALLYDRMGDYAKAESLNQQAIQIWTKTLGPEHPDTTISLENLGRLKFDLGRVLEAKALAQQSARARLTILSKVLSFTSEQQRLAYQDTLDPYSLLAMLNGTDAELASAILRYKGVVLDSLIEDRLIARASKDRDLVGQLAADKRQLGQLLLQTPNKPSGEIDKKIDSLEREVEQMEGQLAQHLVGLGRARRALSVTVEQVQAVIPQDGALIEYVRYDHYLGKGAFEPRYGAAVLAATGPPRWLALGSAKDVDAVVSRYQELVRGASDPGSLSEILESLYAQLWAPIERVLPPGLKRMILSPDSQLNFVSFATLLDVEERFLAEKFTLQYVASVRDLLRDVQPGIRTAAFVFANPDFTLNLSHIVPRADGNPSITGVLRGTEKRGMEDLTFDPLEGTQKECDRLAKAFQGWHWSAEVFTGGDATKAALLQVHSPYILHLATHGFFEPVDHSDTMSTAPQPANLERSVTSSKFFKNPMHCSGLALAGAQSTLEAWKRGEAPAVENNGIVTAEDVAAFDLEGTWLVTLSACDTGSGQAKAGEGVLGLRRGFLQAGAQHLLMTLWPISDETTVQIMTDFYDAARKTANPPQALAEVQLDWLLKIRKEHGLAQAVRLAGPFIMSSQGKP